MRIRDTGWKESDPVSGMEKSRIRVKHQGSATLPGSEIREKLSRIPDPGVKKAANPAYSNLVGFETNKAESKAIC